MSKSFCIILSKAGGIIHGNELMLARAQGSSKIQWMSIILGYHFFFFMKLKFLGQHLVGAGKVGCFFFFLMGLKIKKNPHNMLIFFLQFLDCTLNYYLLCNYQLASNLSQSGSTTVIQVLKESKLRVMPSFCTKFAYIYVQKCGYIYTNYEY